MALNKDTGFVEKAAKGKKKKKEKNKKCTDPKEG